MQKIYEKNAGDLIATLPRTVNYYDSGLIQVSQTFVGRTDLSNKFRSSLEVGDPFPTNAEVSSADSIRIFPAVAENVRPDGLTDFIVTGYGRANTLGIIRFEYGVTTFSLTIPEVVVNDVTVPAITKLGIYRTKTQIIKRVIRINEVYDFNSDIINRMSEKQMLEFTPQFVAGYRTLTGLWSPAVVSFQSQTYGEFQEITVAISGIKVLD